jgi:hypothetical protein
MLHHDTAITLTKKLRLEADCLHLLTLAEPGALPRERLREVIRHQLELLASTVMEHFATEERYGYLVEVIEECPDLESRIVALRHQHDVVRRELEVLIRKASNGCDLGSLQDDISELVEGFDAHEHAENEVLTELRRRQRESVRPAAMA